MSKIMYYEVEVTLDSGKELYTIINEAYLNCARRDMDANKEFIVFVGSPQLDVKRSTIVALSAKHIPWYDKEQE